MDQKLFHLAPQWVFEELMRKDWPMFERHTDIRRDTIIEIDLEHPEHCTVRIDQLKKFYVKGAANKFVCARPSCSKTFTEVFDEGLARRLVEEHNAGEIKLIATYGKTCGSLTLDDFPYDTIHLVDNKPDDAQNKEFTLDIGSHVELIMLEMKKGTDLNVFMSEKPDEVQIRNADEVDRIVTIVFFDDNNEVIRETWSHFPAQEAFSFVKDDMLSCAIGFYVN